MTDQPLPSSTSSSAAPDGSPPSQRWLWIVVALAVLSVVVVVALVLGQRDGTDAPGADGGDTAGDTDSELGTSQSADGDEITGDFETRATTLINGALERFNSERFDLADAEDNPMTMSLYETQQAIDAVTGIDASGPVIVISTELAVNETLVVSDTSEGARGICNVALADTFGMADEIDSIQIVASDGAVITECIHANPS